MQTKIAKARNDWAIRQPTRILKQLKQVFPFLGLVAIILLFQMLSQGRLLSPNNLKAVLNEGFFIIIGSVGYAFLMSQGNLDFSIGLTMAMCSAVTAIVSYHNPFLAILAGMLTGAVIGAINGIVHVVFKVSSIIATLSMQFILSGVVVFVLGNGVMPAPLGILKWNTVQLKLTVLSVVVVAGFLLFNHTKFGKNCRAIGANAQAAFQTGVNVKLTKFIPFVMMGVLMGTLSFFSLIRTGTASNHTGGEMLMNVLNAVLLGGMPISGGASAKYRAVIVGSVTMAFLTNGMAMIGVDTYSRQLIKGLVFLVAIALSFERKNMVIIK